MSGDAVGYKENLSPDELESQFLKFIVGLETGLKGQESDSHPKAANTRHLLKWKRFAKESGERHQTQGPNTWTWASPAG